MSLPTLLSLLCDTPAPVPQAGQHVRRQMLEDSHRRDLSPPLRQKEIVRQLRSRGPLSFDDLQAACFASRDTFRRDLRALIEREVIVHTVTTRRYTLPVLNVLSVSSPDAFRE